MTKTRQWAIVTALAVAVVLVGGWMLLVSPQRSHANDLRTQASTAQQEITQLHSQLATLLSQKRDLPQQQHILAQIATKIPSDPAEPTLIRQLQSAAHTAGVDMSNLSPAAPTPVTATGTTGTTTGGAPSTTGGTTAAAAGLYQIPVTITVSGSYFNVEMFEHSIEQLSRAMLVNGMNVTPANTTSTSSGQTQTPVNGDVTATINAVVFLSPQGATGASTPSATGATTAGSTGS